MRWVKLLGLAVLAEVVLIATAVLFMLIYSSAIHPGEDAAFYDRQARVLLPYVAIVASFPLFYWLVRWAGSGWLWFWAIHVTLDVAISLAADGPGGLVAIMPLWLLSQAAKVLGCWLGGKGRGGLTKSE